MMNVDRIPVPFAGHGAGEGPLTWGQQELWEAMRHRGRWLPIGAVTPLPGGTTVDDAVAGLRFVMDNYPSLRSRLRFDGDQVRQVVAASGEVTLQIVEAADDADPAEVAQEVFARYESDDYDYVSQWPVRMAVVRHRGVLTHRVWVMCHLVADGSAAMVMLRELAARDASGSRSAPTALELASWQGSAAGQRQCRAALAYWERILRTMPERMFPLREPVPAGPRYWRATFDSPALYLAARILGERTGTELASVLLALFVVSTTRVLPLNPVLVQLVVNNRFRPRFADVVSPIIQAGLLEFVVPDATVDSVIRQVRQRAMVAYKYSYCDPARRSALIAQVSKERGMDVDTECGFNDRRLTVRQLDGELPTADQLRPAVARSAFRWVEKQDQEPYAQLYLNIDDVPDTVHLTVTTDTHYLVPDDVEMCVRGMEQIAVAAALDPSERTGPCRVIAMR